VGRARPVTYKITTGNTEAKKFFDQGLRLTYAFNHDEARRAFRKAQRLDPECAMCFWGEALVLGPNINLAMPEEAVRLAFAAVEKAQALAAKARQHEQALIAALSTRYVEDAKADRVLLDAAYASAMARVAAQFPDDNEIAALYAESVMDLSPWDYWQPGGPHPNPKARRSCQPWSWCWPAIPIILAQFTITSTRLRRQIVRNAPSPMPIGCEALFLMQAISYACRATSITVSAATSMR
jgi:hypothetical protein